MLQPAVLPYNEYRKFGVKHGENDLICAKTKKHWNTENPNAVPLRTYLNPAGFWSALYSASN